VAPRQEFTNHPKTARPPKLFIPTPNPGSGRKLWRPIEQQELQWLWEAHANDYFDASVSGWVGGGSELFALAASRLKKDGDSAAVATTRLRF
jgi:hypothetical protein